MPSECILHPVRVQVCGLTAEQLQLQRLPPSMMAYIATKPEDRRDSTSLVYAWQEGDRKDGLRMRVA